MSKLVASGAIVGGLVTAVLALLVAFGVNISPDQHTAIMTTVGALLLALGVVFHPSLPPRPKP